MSRSAIQRIQSTFVVDAPAITDMTLAQACRHVLGEPQLPNPWDKGFLDGYPGEPGLSRRDRAWVLLAAVPAAWAVFALPAILIFGMPALPGL